MYLAAKHGDLKKIREYLEKGSDVNAQDEDSCTLLASACVTGRLEVVRFLQRIPELHRNIPDWTGDTPLMHAIRMGHKEVVEELLKRPHQVSEAYQVPLIVHHRKQLDGKTKECKSSLITPINVWDVHG